MKKIIDFITFNDTWPFLVCRVTSARSLYVREAARKTRTVKRETWEKKDIVEYKGKKERERYMYL